MSSEKITFQFLPEKNQQLIAQRGISFEEVIAALDSGKLLDVVEHHNKEKYSHQKIYVIDMNGYVYLVPYVMKDEHTVFLKTVFPSRKLTKAYLRQRVV